MFPLSYMYVELYIHNSVLSVAKGLINVINRLLNHPETVIKWNNVIRHGSNLYLFHLTIWENFPGNSFISTFFSRTLHKCIKFVDVIFVYHNTELAYNINKPPTIASYSAVRIMIMFSNNRGCGEVPWKTKH